MIKETEIEELKNNPYIEAMAIALLIQRREVDKRPDIIKRYKAINQKIASTLSGNNKLLKKYLLSLDGYYFQYDEMEAYLAGMRSYKNGWARGFGLIMHLYEMQNNKFVKTNKKRSGYYSVKLRKVMGINSIVLNEFTRLYQFLYCSSQSKAKYFFNLGYQANRERKV